MNNAFNFFLFMHVLSTPAVDVGHVIPTIMGIQGKLRAMVDR